ncbi:MAG: hypothetical protein HQ525_01255, partial [Anaerolineae bacterium]|nr:hypothetical protein [Anaerolineae bacterium]
MVRNQSTRLLVIALLVAFALWIGLSETIYISNPFNGEVIYDRNVKPQLGLDLRGGLQVLLEADLPEETEISAESMEVARSVIENRTNALGVAENIVQIAGDRRIVGEFPGLEDTEGVIAIIQQTGLLEFVDSGNTRPPAGTIVQTDYGVSAEAVETVETDGEVIEPTIYHTVMTGAVLDDVGVSQDQV